MKVAFPSTDADGGMESPVYNHFGTAKVFVVVDTENGAVEVLSNQDIDHEHNHCQPLKALGGNKVDVVAVCGIGGGALRKLNVAGVEVYRAVEGTVSENLALFNDGKLEAFKPNQVCGGHGPFGQCIH